MRPNFASRAALSLCVGVLALGGYACGGSTVATPGEDTGAPEDSTPIDTSTPVDGTTTPPPDVSDPDTVTPPTDTTPTDTTPPDDVPPPVDSGPDVITPVDGACPAGLVICGSACVDLSTDPAHCGSCTTICGSSGSCVSGKCVCAGGATMCGTTCVDTSKDPLNCSGCGKRCGSFGTCTAGSCSCPAGTAICSAFGRPPSCADTLQDANYCGTTGCGTNCNNRDYCDGTGKCACRPGLTACTMGGTRQCLDTSASPGACGGCGTTCTAGQVCDGGTCKAGSTVCPTGKTRCTFGLGGGTSYAGCYDTQKDPGHCGGCGTECNQDEMCVAGVCRRYAVAITCTTCPCSDCGVWMGGPATCCPKLTGHKNPICVSGSACP